MKKIFSLFTLVIIIFTLVACGNETTNDVTDNENNTSSFIASNNSDEQESVEPEINDSEAEAQSEEETQPGQSDEETQSEQSEKDSQTETNETKENQESNKDNEPAVKDEPVNDRSAGYDIYITDRGLAIYYFNTCNEEILVERDNTIYEFYNVEYLKDSPIIYYDVNSSNDPENHVIYEFNLNSWQNKRIFEGCNLENIIDYGPYEGYLICSFSYMGVNGLQYDYFVVDSLTGFEVNIGDYYDISDMTNIINAALSALEEDYGDDYPSSGWFENEYVYNQYIDYNEYAAVVIENYDGVNNVALNPIYFCNYAYDNYTALYNIGIFGTIYDVQILSQYSMDSDYIVIDVAEQLTDTLMFIESNFPTDFSNDIFAFYDSLGYYHEIVIEDMSGENAIEFCYGY